MHMSNLPRRFHLILYWLLSLTALLAACIPPTNTSPLELIQTPLPTYTPAPTYTPNPTYTPYPTYTPLPTYTVQPTPTFTPTDFPTPTLELVETIAAADFQDCMDSRGPRQKVRVENTTGDNASLYLYGPENYRCTIPPGTSQIFVVNGNYDLSAIMCGDNLYSFGEHIINPTWVITLKCP